MKKKRLSILFLLTTFFRVPGKQTNSQAVIFDNACGTFTSVNKCLDNHQRLLSRSGKHPSYSWVSQCLRCSQQSPAGSSSSAAKTRLRESVRTYNNLACLLRVSVFDRYSCRCWDVDLIWCLPLNIVMGFVARVEWKLSKMEAYNKEKKKTLLTIYLHICGRVKTRKSSLIMEPN